MYDYIDIPYVLNGRERTVFFKDVRGYKKSFTSSINITTVFYERGDFTYCFHLHSGRDFIRFTCYIQDEPTNTKLVDYPDVEKFIRLRSF